MDFDAARRNMITQQVRAWDVFDNDVLNLLNVVHREDFVPEAYQSIALADMNTPIGEDEVMLTPKEEGKILQALDILPTETVLEIGTGSGYLTALMAKCANHVYSIELNESLAQLAKANLSRYKLDNITLKTGDGLAGWVENAPFDVVVLTGSVPCLSKIFAEQVNVDGRIFAVVGEAPSMQAVLWTKRAKDAWDSVVLFETVVPRLQLSDCKTAFEF